MLNIDLIDYLYEVFTLDKKDELLGLLFKKGHQIMAYFKRSKDISLSKLEILADFYHISLYYFVLNNSFKANKVIVKNNYVGNVPMSASVD